MSIPLPTGATGAVGSRPRSQATTEVLRARVVESALGVFSEHGYEATSVAMLCDAAGISVGSLYHHFTNKAGVAAAVFAEAVRRYQQSLLDVIATNPAAERGVEKLVGAHHDWVAENATWARFMLVMGDLPEIRAAEGDRLRANDRLTGSLADWAEPRMASGELIQVAPAVLGAVLFGPSYLHSKAVLVRDVDPAQRGASSDFAAAAWRALRGEDIRSPKRRRRQPMR